MRIKLWGTRGSLPSFGPETARYGGNTSCVGVQGDDASFLVLDAGSGIKRLGDALDLAASRIDILLTHLHIDHTLGIGYFYPLNEPDMEIHIWGPASVGEEFKSRLARYQNPFFPQRLRDMPCCPTFHDIPLGRFRIGKLEITSNLVCHPGQTVGYRITEGRRSIAYIPDHEPALGERSFPPKPNWMSGFDLASGVDLLIHDTQYADAEYTEHIGWGHSAISHTLAFAAAADVKELVTFHHDPAHNDDQLDAMLAEAKSTSDFPFKLTPGIEGATFQIGDPIFQK